MARQKGTATEKSIGRYWLPLMVWVSGIFVISSLPTRSFPDESGILIPIQYPLHIGAFFVLFLLFYRLLQSKSEPLASGKVILFSFLFTLSVAVAKECWQILIPTRFFSVEDLLVDAGAAILASFLSTIRTTRSSRA